VDISKIAGLPMGVVSPDGVTIASWDVKYYS